MKVSQDTFCSLIAILGSKESGGNFIKLLELRSNEIPELKSIIFKYADPSTYNDICYVEILNMHSNTVTRYQLNVYNVDNVIYGIIIILLWYMGLNIFEKEQESIVIRLIDDYLKHIEFFFIKYTTGRAIADIIYNILIR